jgi:hypothetical protein
MPRRKWCFGRRDIICQTQDCPYMRGCIEKVAQDRADEFAAAAKDAPRRTMIKIKSELKELERRRPKLERVEP